jgi:hypothetical protein
MRKIAFSIAAAGAWAGATLLTASTIAAPVSNLGSFNAATATLDSLHQIAFVCDRWHCWRGPRYGGQPWDWGGWRNWGGSPGPGWGWHGRW